MKWALSIGLLVICLLALSAGYQLGITWVDYLVHP